MWLINHIVYSVETINIHQKTCDNQHSLHADVTTKALEPLEPWNVGFTCELRAELVKEGGGCDCCTCKDEIALVQPWVFPPFFVWYIYIYISLYTYIQV